MSSKTLWHSGSPPLREQFTAEIRGHRLRREIVTTALVNEIVDKAGITHLFRPGGQRLVDRRRVPGRTSWRIEVFGMDDIFERILQAPAAYR